MSFLVFRANVPDGVNVGRVEGFYVTHLADRDADGVPDEDHLDGTATFTPRVNEMRWPTLDPPRTSVKLDIVCPIIQGFIYPPGTTQDDVENNPGLQRGVVLIATDQPLAEPNSVQYDVKIDLVGSRVNPVTKPINIPAGGTLDLAMVQGAATVPGTVTVVSSEDRIRAEAAAVDAAASERSALGAAESAEANALLTSTHVLETRAARDRAEAARTEAAGSADVAVAARDDAGNAALAAERAEAAAVRAEQIVAGLEGWEPGGGGGTASWDTLAGKPAVVAAGADKASARAAIDAGTSDLTTSDVEGLIDAAVGDIGTALTAIVEGTGQ